MRVFKRLSICTLLLFWRVILCEDNLEDDGIDEHEAVIEFDETDDLFKFLSERESACVHLYSRKEPTYLARKKAFRKAAKRDIDQAKKAGLSRKQTTNWIAIDKGIAKGQNQSAQLGNVIEDEIDDEKLMQVFGVHEALTFYGYMNMKTSIGFPIATSGDHIVEDAVEVILIEKRRRVQQLMPSVNCEKLADWLDMSTQPTVAFFGPVQAIQGVDAPVGFLKHVQQANLMAFTREQHTFVAVHDQKCIRQHDYSTGQSDWTLAYYPAMSQKPSKVLRVQYPQSRLFGEVVHFLDQAYTSETQTWSKHAKICLMSHQLTTIALLLDTDDASKFQKTTEIFTEAVQRVIDVHDLEVVPIVYPVRQVGGFGDESDRLETVLGIDLAQVKLPQIVMVHGSTKKNLIYEHSLGDPDEFIADLVTYWAVNKILQADAQHRQNRIIKLTLKLEGKIDMMDPDSIGETKYEIAMHRKALGEIDSIMERSKHAYDFAKLESRWGRYMRENEIFEAEERLEFLKKVFVEESEIESKQNWARSQIQDLIDRMDADLQQQGVTDEQERLKIILRQLQMHEQQMSEQQSSSDVDQGVVNEEL